jgi:hypothetical protein
VRLSLAKPCDVFNAGAVPWEPAAGGVAEAFSRDILLRSVSTITLS